MRLNTCQDYQLRISVDPGHYTQKHLSDVLEWASKWIPTEIWTNVMKLGVRKNPYYLLKDTFEQYEQVVYLEEDLVISPDALRMCNWYFDTLPANEYLCLNLMNYSSKEKTQYWSDPKYRLDQLVNRGKDFSSLGLAINRYQWTKTFEKAWLEDEEAKTVYKKTGWDWSIRARIYIDGMRTLTPLVSRSNHTWREGGVHCLPEQHDELFKDLCVNGNPDPGEYKIVEHEMQDYPEGAL